MQWIGVLLADLKPPQLRKDTLVRPRGSQTDQIYQPDQTPPSIMCTLSAI